MSEKTQELQKSSAIARISEEDINLISEDLRLKLTREEASAIYEFCGETCKSYQRVYELVAPTPEVKYPRTPGYRETEDSSWYYRCDIKGAENGLLKGKTVAIKDNVSVAGVPMMNGSKLLEGFVPDRDATVVTRILDAGGRITGKSVCEDMCFSGSSFTASSGPVRNPYDATRTTGGSSSGSASLLVRKKVDVAIGGDQGGSIRIPASWCGIVGLKPTYGLVPYTGIMPIEMTYDHVGPMARTVEDCATLLEVIAGYDSGNDPRQFPVMTHPPYSQLVNDGIKGKKIGLLTEGFIGVEEDLAGIVRQAALTLKEAGAEVSDVSLPIHSDGVAIWTPVDFEGTYQMMIKGNGHGYGWKGAYDLPLQEALTGAFDLRPFDCPLPVKIVMIFAEYMQRNYQNKFYSKAQNLIQHLTMEYNRILKDYDVIVMPTSSGKPIKLPTRADSIGETLKLVLGMIKNTAPFNATGHPALSVNAGLSEGLPCGMMIVGRMFDDLTVLQVARAFEKIRDGAK
ncbi:amidase-like isoform X1 [Crassostrea angulata]|uniref:amidase-like isoform X1 n=1 Tax=Magallana angulata TaxID=2784310 RepID=UPI0022B0ED1D|nr:amidase-like isoform X1 [Crassostrea angulata]